MNSIQTASFILIANMITTASALAQSAPPSAELAGATLGANGAANARSANSSAQSAVHGTPGSSSQTQVDPTLGPLVMQSQGPATNNAPPTQITLVPRRPNNPTTPQQPVQIPVNCNPATAKATQNNSIVPCGGMLTVYP